MSEPKLMTPQHPLWRQFCERLGGPEGCAFHEDASEKIRWKCRGGNDHGAAFEILNTMPGVDVRGTLKWMRENGAGCDCEILFNLDCDSGTGSWSERGAR